MSVWLCVCEDEYMYACAWREFGRGYSITCERLSSFSCGLVQRRRGAATGGVSKEWEGAAAGAVKLVSRQADALARGDSQQLILIYLIST